MTRRELIQTIVMQARGNGFPFQRWFERTIDAEWTSQEAAIELLATGNRYYALLFSHEFAQSFWKAGSVGQFLVPTQQFTRLNSKGQLITVTRKAYTRRSLKPDAWRYHLREMAVQEEPLRHIRRFVVAQDETRAQRPDCGDNGDNGDKEDKRDKPDIGQMDTSKMDTSKLGL